MAIKCVVEVPGTLDLWREDLVPLVEGQIFKPSILETRNTRQRYQPDYKSRGCAPLTPLTSV